MVPCSRAAAASRSITCSPVSESSDPVGSSANSTSGSGDQPAGQRDPLGLPAGQLPGSALLQPVQAEPPEPRPGLLQRPAPGGCRPAAAAARRSPRRSARGRAGRTGTRTRTGPGAGRCARSRAWCRPGRRRTRSPRSRGIRIPARQCSSVDLPEPLGPMTARISPAATDTLAPRSAGVWPKDRTTSRASIRQPRRPGSGGEGRRAVIERTSSASADSRAAVRSIHRRSASRWNRPWSASSASTRLPVRLSSVSSRIRCRWARALGVEVALGGASQHQRQHDLGRTAPSAGAARARPARPAMPRPRSPPGPVMT